MILIIVPDGGNHKGTLTKLPKKHALLRFKTTGKQCHASLPQLGKNAFVAASHLVTKLDISKTFCKNRLSYLNRLSALSRQKKKQNVYVNTIPGEDVFYLDCRVLPQYNLKDLSEIKTQRPEQKFKVKIEISEVQKLQVTKPTSAAAPAVHALQKAVKTIYAVKASAGGVGAGTAAAFFRKEIIPPPYGRKSM